MLDTVMIGAYDRTSEFRSCAKSCHQRVLTGRLILKPSSRQIKHYGGPQTREFLTATRALSNDVQRTETKLKKLLFVFDSSQCELPADVAKLVEVIRLDIVDLNKTLSNIRTLERKLTHELSYHSQLLKHYNLMTKGLEYRLAILVNAFQKSLEINKGKVSIQTSSVDPQKTAPHLPVMPLESVARSNISAVPCINQHSNLTNNHFVTFHPVQPTNNFHNKTETTKSHARFNPAATSSHRRTNLPPDHSRTPHPNNFFPEAFTLQEQQEQELQQLTLPDQELRQRDANMKRVESTIIQLGEIYQQFSTLVHEQSDLVTRIDSHTEDTELNVSAAHYQLSLFLRSVSARRALMIKVFVTVFICFVLFAWFKR